MPAGASFPGSQPAFSDDRAFLRAPFPTLSSSSSSSLQLKGRALKKLAGGKESEAILAELMARYADELKGLRVSMQ